MNSAVARHLDVVEDHEGVLLVEAARQRMVEAVVRRRHAVAAEELQPRRAHRNAEGQRIVVGALRAAAAPDRPRSRRRTAPAWPARARRAPRCRARCRRPCAAHARCRPRGASPSRLVDGRLDDGVGERDVVAAQELLVGDQPLGARLVAVRAPFVGAAGEARVGDVHVVGRAAHQADGIFGDLAQRLVAPRRDPRASAGSCG